MPGDASKTQRFLPVGLDIRGRECLVVGGGGVATRKALRLLKSGGGVTVVSPTLTERLAEEVDAGRMRWHKDSFQEEHLRGIFLVVTATNDEVVNAAVVQGATGSGALVCDATSAERSQVIFGAVLEGDGTTIAVFTDGRDPALARRTRDRIAHLLEGPAVAE